MLDPEAPTGDVVALADWVRHVEPDLRGWLQTQRRKLHRIFPAEIVLAANQAELQAGIATADVAIVEALAVTEKEIGQAARLKLVQKFGTVSRNIDEEACRARGISVSFLRRRVNISNAEHAIALLLALAKQLNLLNGVVTPERLQKAGRAWGKINGPFTLNGTTLGIIGLGEIGREVARVAKALEMNVLYSQRTPLDRAAESALGVAYADRQSLLAASDAITIHLPLVESTRGLLGEREFELMKPSALLVNTSRAAIVDQAALLRALRRGHLGGVALDALYSEPMAEDDPLLSFENVILTPHIAGRSPGSMLADLAATVLAIDAGLSKIAEGQGR
jgi:phosphoglycerate dehydrogenase-like enzyme